jgi:ribonuclease D
MTSPELPEGLNDPVFTYKYITKQADFDAFMVSFQKDIKKIPYIAIDTEFERRTTYYPEFCLLQIATPARDITIIDPLEVKDFSALEPILKNKNIVKIFHAGTQDIEIFQHEFKTTPVNVFDTQIAARFCPDSADYETSYANMIQWLCGVELDKTHQTADWKKRPITPEALKYACFDVVYLLDAYEILLKKLKKLGHLDKVIEDCQYFSEKTFTNKSEDELWSDFPRKDLSKDKYMAAKEILFWRERTARAQNVPKSRLINDKEIISLANALKSEKRMIFKDHIQRRLTLFDDLKDFIKDLKENLPVEAEDTETKQRLSRNEFQRQEKELKAIRDEIAQKTSFDPRILATNKDITNFLRGKDGGAVPFLQGWRYDIFGKKIRKI